MPLICEEKNIFFLPEEKFEIYAVCKYYIFFIREAFKGRFPSSYCYIFLAEANMYLVLNFFSYNSKTLPDYEELFLAFKF